MKISWPAYRVTLEAHTVNTGKYLAAGFLARDTGSRRELGYLWPSASPSGGVWRWRSADGQHYGERASQGAAVEVLHDTFAATHAAPRTRTAPRYPGDELPLLTDADLPSSWRQTSIILTDGPSNRTARPTRPAPAPAAPAPVSQQIKWADDAPAGNIMDALARGFQKGKA